MGLLRALTDAIYREYDRRIKRASVITEYGVHHQDHGADHVADAQAGDEHAEEGEAEIVNVPRGTPVAAHEPAPDAAAETTDRH